MSAPIEPVVLQRIAEAADRLVSVDLAGRGVTLPLYAAARERQGGQPLVLGAAQAFRKALQSGGTALIATGFVIPGTDERAETDGPLGAAVLARAFGRAWQVNSVVLAQERHLGFVAATLRAAEVTVVPIETLPSTATQHCPVAAVAPFPLNDEMARQEAARLMAQLRPRAIVGIEALGPNERGVYHLLRGFDWSQHAAKYGQLFSAATGAGILTAGIGDGGNEIGMGLVVDVLRPMLPHGERCQCPCGGGVGDATRVDKLVVSAVSNWGAYGVVAALGAMLDRADLLHTGDIEADMLRACVDAGGVDGLSGRSVRAVDGISEHVHVAMVEMLGEMLRQRGAAGIALERQARWYYGLPTA